MQQIHALSEKERRWLSGGVVFGVLLTLILTAVSQDKITTFLAAVGAIGQVGIAVALYFVNRAQWKLQEHLAQEEKRQQAERLRLIRQIALDNIREEIDSFYRTRDADAREECHDRMSEHLFQLKVGLNFESARTIRKFLRFSSHIISDMDTEEGCEANGRRMDSWRKSANTVLGLVGAAPLDFGKRRE